MRALLLLGLLVAATAGQSAELQDNLYTGVSTEIVTPHLTWARPYAGGTTRVLVIAPAWGQRETVELQQRFDFDCRAVMTDTHINLAQEAGFLSPDKVALRFDQGLAWKPDVIVIGGLNWGMLLLEHRAEILRQVQAGAGLVYVGPPKNDELAQLFSRDVEDRSATIAAGLPWDLLTAFRERRIADIIQSGTFGQGRWVALRYQTNSTNQSLTPSLWPWPASWEYEPYIALVGRAVLCAAKRQPSPVLSPPLQDAFAQANLPATLAVPVKLPADRPAHVTGSVLRVPDGPSQPLAPAAVAGGQARLSLPVLPDGRYVAHLVAADAQGRALDWGSFPFTVSAPRQGVLHLPQAAYDAGDTISGEVTLIAPLAPGQWLRVRLWDNHGRLLGEQRGAAGQELKFSFPNVRPLGTSLVRLEASVLDGRGEVRTSAATLPVRYRQRPDFHLACWEESEVDYISGLWYRRFRELGMDAIFYTCGRGNREAAARTIAEADLCGASAFAGYYPKAEQSDLGPVHNPCLHAPAYQQASREAADKSRPFALCDNLFYPSGSDAGMRGNCFSPQTLAAFRQWLQRRYKSLEELNAAWGTTFGSWEAVVPDSFDKAKARAGNGVLPPAPSLQGGGFASWVEHTRFMEQSYREHLQDVTREIRSFDPQALVGEDGYGRLNSTDGADWWNLLHDWGFVNLYTYQDPPQMEIVRSLARSCPNLKLRSLYWGSYDGQFGNQRFMRWLPWYALLHDYNGLFWWIANGKATYGSAPGVAGPDFRLTRTYATSLSEVQDIRRGLAELVQPAQRHHDGVAIFYDQTAIHAVTAYKHPSALVGAYTVFQALLEDLGLQYDYVAGAQVEQGLLGRQGYRVLVMAQALALSEGAAKQVRDFVNQGGLVIADVLPGQYDTLLRPTFGGSLLADLFGKPGEVKRVGQGSTVLMDVFPTDYVRRRTEEAGQRTRATLQTWLEPLHLTPLARFSGDNGEAVPGVEVVTYTNRGTSFTGVLNDTGKPVSGRLTASGRPCVTNVRTHQSLGEGTDWPVTLEPGETKLFALCPYEVTGLIVKPERAGVAAGQTWQARVQAVPSRGRANAAHSFVTEVFDPAGQPHPLYAQALPAGGEAAATVTIPFALNDAPGQWRVRVTETISGRTADAAITVTAPPRP